MRGRDRDACWAVHSTNSPCWGQKGSGSCDKLGHSWWPSPDRCLSICPRDLLKDGTTWQSLRPLIH